MKKIGDSPLLVSDDETRLAIPSVSGFDLYELAGRDGLLKARYRFVGEMETEPDAAAWVDGAETHKTGML